MNDQEELIINESGEIKNTIESTTATPENNDKESILVKYPKDTQLPKKDNIRTKKVDVILADFQSKTMAFQKDISDYIVFKFGNKKTGELGILQEIKSYYEKNREKPGVFELYKFIKEFVNRSDMLEKSYADVVAFQDLYFKKLMEVMGEITQDLEAQTKELDDGKRTIIEYERILGMLKRYASSDLDTTGLSKTDIYNLIILDIIERLVKDDNTKIVEKEAKIKELQAKIAFLESERQSLKTDSDDERKIIDQRWNRIKDKEFELSKQQAFLITASAGFGVDNKKKIEEAFTDLLESTKAPVDDKKKRKAGSAPPIEVSED